jgi:hypothetical protein
VHLGSLPNPAGSYPDRLKLRKGPDADGHAFAGVHQIKVSAQAKNHLLRHLDELLVTMQARDASQPVNYTLGSFVLTLADSRSSGG